MAEYESNALALLHPQEGMKENTRTIMYAFHLGKSYAIVAKGDPEGDMSWIDWLLRGEMRSIDCLVMEVEE